MEEFTPKEIEKAIFILEKIKKDDLSGLSQKDIQLAIRYVSKLENDQKKELETKNEYMEDGESPASIIQRYSDLLTKDDYTLVMEYINTNLGGTNNATLGDLIYKGTRDGDQNFHKFVDETGPNLVLISANGNLFGGFTSINFSSTNSGFRTDTNAFIFSLTTRTKFPVYQKTNYWAIYNVTGTYAFFFGYPSDIVIYDGFLSSSMNQSRVGQCYRLTPDDTTPAYLAGTEYYKVDELEVYKVFNYTQL